MSSSSPIIDADHIAHNSDVISADCNGEVVLLRIETGRCYGMNATGSNIWRRLAAPTRVTDLVVALQNEFPAEGAECSAQIFTFLGHLTREGLISRVDTSLGTDICP